MPTQNSLNEITKEDVVAATRQAYHTIIEHTRTTHIDEVVGAVLRDGSVRTLTNEHTEPALHFQVSAGQLDEIEDDVVAIYHSHPLGTEYPTIADVRGLTPIPAIIVTPTHVILWWFAPKVGYYRIWDMDY